MIIAFLGLANVFNTVTLKLLLEKLVRYGIRGTFLELITSYLSNRKQKVKIQDQKSIENEMYNGVPQGTILRPLFFYCMLMIYCWKCRRYCFVLREDIVVIS